MYYLSFLYRLHNNIQKTLEELEVEVSDRIRFMETSTEMLSWMSDTNVALMTSDSGRNMSEGLENIEKQKVNSSFFQVMHMGTDINIPKFLT